MESGGQRLNHTPVSVASAMVAHKTASPPANLPKPLSTLPARARPKEVPPGVPEYNYRMCQYDLIEMGAKKQQLLFDNPSGFGE
jgi:hypothetical protein